MYNTGRRVYLIAGEPSGDVLGARLMRSIRELSSEPVSFAGIGGERMQAEKMRSLFPYEELAVMGITEVLPHAFRMFARIDQTIDDIRTKSPDVIVTIDAPGFTQRVVEKLKKENYPAQFVHYVAPSVWAWKPGRAKEYARLFDHLLTLLPFEPPYFEKEGLASTFVGHPIVVETQKGDGAAFRARHDIAPEVPVFSVLPGSRAGEIRRLMPIFARSITLLSEIYPNLAICVPVPKYLLATVKPYFEACPFRAIVSAHEEDRRDGLAASKLAIVKSGTVSLEVAKAGTPMVVAYRVNPVSAFLFKRMRLIKFATLVNILLHKEVIPELLQDDCNPLMIASAASHILTSPQAVAAQAEAVSSAFAMMTPERGTPSEMAAGIVLNHMN